MILFNFKIENYLIFYVRSNMYKLFYSSNETLNFECWTALWIFYLLSRNHRRRAIKYWGRLPTFRTKQWGGGNWSRTSVLEIKIDGEQTYFSYLFYIYCLYARMHAVNKIHRINFHNILHHLITLTFKLNKCDY